MSALATLERWSIRRWNHSPDLASIFQELHDARSTGRVMIHLSNGGVTAIEFCERTIEPQPSRCYIRASQSILFLTTELNLP
jgi:hypothetical protein